MEEEGGVNSDKRRRDEEEETGALDKDEALGRKKTSKEDP